MCESIGQVLLVDDYADARETMRDALEEAGYPVLEAANGQQALNLLVSTAPGSVALILLDLQMPVMDGWRLLEVLRSYVSLAKIPVIIVTAGQPYLERIRHRGVFACIQGPYEVSRLVETVRRCLASTVGGTVNAG